MGRYGCDYERSGRKIVIEIDYNKASDLYGDKKWNTIIKILFSQNIWLQLTYKARVNSIHKKSSPYAQPRFGIVTQYAYKRLYNSSVTQSKKITCL